MSSDNLQDVEAEETLQQQREMHKRKYLAVSRHCKDIEQVNERVLNRLHQVEKITRKLKHERRFLMKILDSYGDDYRQSQLNISLEDEIDILAPGNIENKPPEDGNSSAQRRASASLPGMDYKTFESSTLTEATPVKKRKTKQRGERAWEQESNPTCHSSKTSTSSGENWEEDYGCDAEEELPIDWRH